MELIIKGCLGAALAIAFTLLGRSKEGSLAGMLALFPVFSLLGYWLLASSSDAETVRQAAKASLIGTPVLLAFFGATWLLMGTVPWRVALLGALAVWVAMAAIWLRWVL